MENINLLPIRQNAKQYLMVNINFNYRYKFIASNKGFLFDTTGNIDVVKSPCRT